MNNEYIAAFLDGATQMIMAMTGGNCTHQQLAKSSTNAYITSTIKLWGHAEGQMSLLFSKEGAMCLVAEIGAMDLSEVDDDTIRDGVGEMANIIAGNAKANLVGTDYHFQLSLPLIVTGKEQSLELFRAEDPNAYRLSTDFGDFEMNLWLLPVSK